MQTLPQEPQQSTEPLQAVSQLSNPDLDKFLDQVLSLRAERRAPHLSREASELRLKTNNTLLAEDTWKRL